MEEIDKLLDLFKAGEVELMWQLSKSLDIDGVELWTKIYNEFKQKSNHLTVKAGCVHIFKHSDCYALFIKNNYSDEDYNSDLEPIIIRLIKYLDGELR